MTISVILKIFAKENGDPYGNRTQIVQILSKIISVFMAIFY